MKKELYRSHLESMESNDYRAMLIGEAWAQGDDPSELKNYTTKINKVTKEDVVAVANKYYGDNYLAFYSKMGSFKGEKIEKPDYKPVVSNTNARSVFNQSLDGIGESEFAPRFIDFDKDVTMSQLKDGVKLYRCENPLNDIFSLDIRFDAGKEEIPMLEYVIPIMDMAYTEAYSKKEIKDEMSRIAASYYFEFDESYTHLHLTGIESDLERTLDLMNELLTNPQMDDKEIETLVDYIKGDRKFENAEPYDVAQAAMEYVKYGSESDYMDRLTMKEVKALEIRSLVNEFRKLQGYSVELHYVGKRPMKDLEKVLSEHLQFGDNLKETDVPVIKPVKVYNDNEVFFVHKKNAVQSQVMFMQNGKLITLDDVPSIQAFNSYFGGGFSGLVMQEIREYRSLAYSAAAWTEIPDRMDSPSAFKGYIGTQADKTDEAISTFMDLVRNTPDKEDRIDMIRTYLKYSVISYQPEFRRIIPYVIKKQKQGYPEVPAKFFQDEYAAITYRDIRTYYEENVQKTPTVVVVVGDKKKVEVDGLKKYGRLNSLKEDQLYTN
ncbi:MAG: insulinase family protein [Flavobacteriales bacterium]